MNFKYIKQAKLNPETEEKCKRLGMKKERKIQKAVKKAKSNYYSLAMQNDMIKLCVVLCLCEDTHEKYTKLGISEKVFSDTFCDIGLWCSNNADKGLREYLWIKNHLNASLFRLGRLQFQLRELNEYEKYFSSYGLSSSDSVLFVHIPQGGSLDAEQCRNSLEKARNFFCTHFSQVQIKAFVCESWLLYENNREFMKEDSNILKFAQLFDVTANKQAPRQAIERVFGKRKIFTGHYPEKTSLQKSLKAYLKSGKRPGIGIGIIKF